MFTIRELVQDKKLIFFGGKGGVGKTTLSAASALIAANSQRKTLLVSTDPAHNLGHLLDQSIGSTITTITENLDVLELDPKATISQHLDETAKVLRRLMPIQLTGEVDKHIELSRHAPGMHEAALLERVAQVVIEASRDYDLIVFDTAPSGHTAQLMALPEMMTAWTDGLLKRREKSEKLSEKINALGNVSGEKNRLDKNLFGSTLDNDCDKEKEISDEEKNSEPSNLSERTQERDQMIRDILNRRRERFSDLRNALIDSKNTAFVIVLTAERLPVLETVELYDQLKQMKINVVGTIINKRLPQHIIERQDSFFKERQVQEEKHLNTLAQSLPRVPSYHIPLAQHDIVGLDALTRFSEQLLK